MASHLLNRGRGIVWRRRIPRRVADSLGRSHVLVYLGTRDPREAARLGRRLSVVFDDFLDAMNSITRTPTPEDLENLLQIFRKIVRERCETAQLLEFRPTEEQRSEYLKQAPSSLEELDARVAAEQEYLDHDPDARAMFEERRSAWALTEAFRDLAALAGKWQDAFKRNDPSMIRGLLGEAMAAAKVSISPNSLAYARLGRDALKEGVHTIQEGRGQDPKIEPIRPAKKAA